MADPTRAPSPLSLGAFLAAIAAAYSLLSVASGLAVRFSPVDLISATVFWGGVGAVATVAARRFAGTLLRERPLFAWTLAGAGWAIVEGLFTAIVVAKPTRWPPLLYSAIGIGLPAMIAGAIALTALRRGAKEQRLRGLHPALVIVACWTMLSALLLWLPRWLQAFANAPGIGWILWGILDLVWIVTGVAAVVVAGAAILKPGKRWPIVAVALAAIQLVPLATRGGGSTRPATSSPSIVWIMLDGVRADHVSAYGYKRATMPNLERLATGGTLVQGHVSAGVRTENTYSKMLALAPTLDRYEAASPVPLSAVRELLPASMLSQAGIVSTLQARGYETALFHVFHDLLEDKGLQPWLQSFDDTYRTRLSGDASVGSYLVRMLVGDHLDGMPRMDRWAAYRRRFLAEQVSSEVKEFLTTRHDERPLFLIVHLAGAHKPNYRFGTPRLPDPPSARVGEYDDSVRSGDEQVAKLVDVVRATLKNPTIFVFADHGEVMKGEPMLPQYMTVPLLVIPPLPAAPAVPTTSQDIVAMSLAIAGNATPRCDGRLARDLRCPSKPDELRVVDHTGHGKLMFASSLAGSLVAAEIKAEPAVGSLGATMTICEFFHRSQLTASQLVVGPLDTREGFAGRLQRQLDKCPPR